MDVRERIAALRREMERCGIDAYIVPSADHHQSEYVGGHFMARQYITGFTGSAGTAVITGDWAGLWTDGRYFIQAAQELEGSGITLFRSGEPGVDTPEEFLKKELPEGGTLGFDGRTTGVLEGKRYCELAEEKGGMADYGHDLVGRIWSGRPPLPKDKVFLLDEKYAGEPAGTKLKRVREKMAEVHADVHLLSSLDDIAWLLNIRGNDIAYCPLVLSYLLLFADHGVLYGDREKFPEQVLGHLGKENIRIRPYAQIYDDIRALPAGSTILLDASRVNYTLFRRIPEGVRTVEQENPEVRMKCIKNETEVSNMKRAHLKDAVAHTRFLYWMKKAAADAGTAPGTPLRDENGTVITEMTAAEKLEELRAMQEGYLGASFAPISAFAEHGAIVHYSATQESSLPLATGKMLLTDTGGHYLEGTTDITRTVALGDISRREKEDFTLTARAMLRLMDTVFLYGCSGANLDLSAREVFWKERVNFDHGTGHGVGYLLNVHEGPVNFRWREGAHPAPCLEENMVITDEPGIYIEGSHGVRLENVLLVRPDVTNGYGRFLHFEPLTFVPVDLDALLPEKMTEEERRILNDYHRTVRETLSVYLDGEEREWLREATRPV